MANRGLIIYLAKSPTDAANIFRPTGSKERWLLCLGQTSMRIIAGSDGDTLEFRFAINEFISLVGYKPRQLPNGMLAPFGNPINLCPPQAEVLFNSKKGEIS